MFTQRIVALQKMASFTLINEWNIEIPLWLTSNLLDLWTVDHRSIEQDAIYPLRSILASDQMHLVYLNELGDVQDLPI